MRKLLSKDKREYQPRVRYHLFRNAMKSASIPGRWILPRIDLPFFGMATVALLIVGLVLWLGLFLIKPDSAFLPVVKTVNSILFWVTLVSLVLAGDNGLRLAHWEGLLSFSLRKLWVVADATPISRRVVRFLFSSLFAGELALLIWWLVVQAAKPLPPEMFSDPLLYEEAQLGHFNTQMGLYWWLPLILGPVFRWALMWLEGRPIVGFLLRQTRLLILPIVPLLGYLESRMIINWALELTGFTISVRDFVPWFTG